MGKPLSQMTDAELEAIANAAPASAPKAAEAPKAKSLSHTSDAELEKIAGTPEVGIADKVTGAILGGLGAVGRQVDRFTGAPVRAAIGAIQDGKGYEGIPAAGKAFMSQFGKEPEAAPTGKEIAAKAGLSAEPYIRTPFRGLSGETFKVSPAGVAGFGIDALADPTNLIPGELLLKGGAKAGVLGAKEIGGGVIKGGAKAVDVLTGTEAATKIVGGAADRAKAVKLAMSDLFSPKRAKDFKEMEAVAKANGIDTALLPESVEFGQNSVISRAARVRREGPLGEPHLEKFAQGLEQVKQATKRKIEQIGGGPTLSRPEAGALIRQAHDDAISEVMSNLAVTYKGIANAVPELAIADDAIKAKLDPVANEIWKFAEKRSRLALTDFQKSQADQLLRAVNAVMGTDKTMGDYVDLMQHVGEAAYQSRVAPGVTPPDIERLQKLYGAMSDTVMDTVKSKIGKDTADTLAAYNDMLTNALGNNSVLSKVTNNKDLSDEGVFRALVENGDTRKAQAMKELLPGSAMRKIRAAYLESLIRPSNLEGDFNFKPLINAVNAKKELIGALFDPQEIKDMSDLMQLGDRWGLAIMSTSGTGATNMFKDFVKGVQQGVVSDALIENLKVRARGKDVLPPPPAGIRVPIHGLQGGGITLPYRSGWEMRGKGAQVISTQDNEPNNDRRKAVRGK